MTLHQVIHDLFRFHFIVWISWPMPLIAFISVVALYKFSTAIIQTNGMVKDIIDMFVIVSSILSLVMYIILMNRMPNYYMNTSSLERDVTSCVGLSSKNVCLIKLRDNPHLELVNNQNDGAPTNPSDGIYIAFTIVSITRDDDRVPLFFIRAEHDGNIYVMQAKDIRMLDDVRPKITQVDNQKGEMLLTKEKENLWSKFQSSTTPLPSGQ